VLSRLTCALLGHQPVRTQTRHSFGRDIIAERSDCSRCHRTLHSWPPPLGASTRLTPHESRSGSSRVVPITDLDARAWSIMCWRQEHLPLDRVRSRGDRDSLSIVEGRAANKVAARFGLDELHTFSLSAHHGQEVKRRLADAKPMLGRGQDVACPSRAEMRIVSRHRRRRLRALNFTVGWGTWFSNRRVGLRWRLFRLRTRNAYRGIGAQ